MKLSLYSTMQKSLYAIKYGFCVGALVGATLTLQGCSNSSPVYYSLMQRNGAPYPAILGGVQTIKVYAPSIPERLDRDTVVLSSQYYRVSMDDNATWSEPLSTLLGHTLARNLSQRLPGRIVFSQNDAVSASPQVNVSLSINQCDLNTENHAVIDGILSFKRVNSGETTSMPVHWVSEQPIQKKADALAVALSDGMGVIADQTAQSLSVLRIP